jgi:hypothetical protein
MAPPPGDCQGPAGGGPNCSKDTDCTEGGVDGRCIENNGGALICYCTYDTCGSDASCGTGSTCACHGSAYNNGGNTCVPGNCRVDADCGAGGYCSPSESTSGCGGVVAGYYCHTAGDLCINDSDCSAGGFGEACIYSTTASVWSCQRVPLCAVVR